MFPDPMAVTVSGTAKSLPRVAPSNGMMSTYALPDKTLEVSIGHTRSAKGRRIDSIRCVSNKIAADPFVAGVSRAVSSTVRITIDSPSAGFTVDDLAAQVKALADFLTTSSNANSIKLIGGEF